MKGRVIAVTGGFGILGRSIVAELADRGAIPIAIDRADAPETPAGNMDLSNVDISDPVAAAAVVAQIRSRYGRLDGLANVAGMFRWETILDGSPGTWETLYQVNVRTALVMSMASVPALLETKGGIVNVGAASATKAALGMGAYTASKSAVARLTEALAEEFKDGGVRVNAVLPSIIDTPANRADMPNADASLWVAPLALARVMIFLLSDEASAITGATLPVTGRA